MMSKEIQVNITYDTGHYVRFTMHQDGINNVTSNIEDIDIPEFLSDLSFLIHTYASDKTNTWVPSEEVN